MVDFARVLREERAKKGPPVIKDAKGKIALCSRGHLGIITENEPQQVTYADKSTGLAYVGVHLQPKDDAKAGDPWSSRHPQILGDPILLSTLRDTYESFEAAIGYVKDARDFQMKEWPNTQRANAGGRPFEEWLVLLRRYITKMEEVYAETPGTDKVTNLPNVEGRKRIRKYAAIIANLAVWAVQSAVGTAGQQD